MESLKNINYFSGLNAAGLDSIQKFVFERAVAGGKTILFEGEPAGAIYFVVSGLVRVFKTSADGKEQVLYLVHPGESFNDVPVHGGEYNLASARAMGPVILYGIRKSHLAAVFREYPQVALNVIQVLSRRVEYLVSLVEDLSFRSVTNRVAKILLEYTSDGTGQKPRLTQQDMAAMAGTVREMVGRALKTLEEEGTIRLNRQRIIITNKEALKEMAGIAS